MRRATLLTIWLVFATAVLAAPLAASSQFPERIPLPNGFRPEGIAIKGTTFYVGSIPTGAIFRGDLRTGEGSILNPGAAGRAAIGVEYDDGHLFVAGGPTGKGFVYSARSGRLLAEHQLTTTTPTFVNDVAVTRKAAYFTDSRLPFLYRLSDRKHGSRSAVKAIPLTGEIQYTEGNNANGIEATRDGRTLIIVQSNLGKLFRVNARSGRAREIRLNEPVVNGDGILLDGRTLYVVQNRDNKVAVVRLDRRLRSGTVVTHITDPRPLEPAFDVPTTIDDLGHKLYAVNARFNTVPNPDTAAYWIAQFRKVKTR
jgi:sugar lactone lactonase YvrE